MVPAVDQMNMNKYEYEYIYNALLVLACHMTTFASQTFRIRSRLRMWHYCCETKQLWQYILFAA